MTHFIHTQKQKQLLMKVTLRMYLDHFILQLYQTYKNRSGWIIDSVIEHNINISKYNPLAGSSYIKIPKALDHPRRGWINIRNIDDNECFKCSLVRYLHPADQNPRRITKVDKGFA